MDDRQRKVLEQAREHYQAGRYDDAEQALVTLAADRVPFADVYCMLGVVHYHAGSRIDALAMFEEALRLNPGYTEAALHLSVTLQDLGRYDEAKKVYRRMLASRKNPGPEHVDPFVKGKIANMHADVGLAYEQAALHEDAVQEYKRALALCPSYVDLRTKLGICLRGTRNFPAAEKELLRAKRENPNLVGPRLQLGMTYYSMGRRTDAARQWREVLAMEPDNRFAKLYLRLLAVKDPKAKGSLF